MNGASTVITIQRPVRDSAGRQSGTEMVLAPLRVRIQYEQADGAVEKAGQTYRARLTAPASATLQTGDFFLWDNRRWRIHATEQVVGRGGYLRAVATSTTQ